MYDIKQFRPAFYFLLFLGLTGFTLAIEEPGLWALSVGVVALHAWLVRSGRFRPLPRLVANVITLGALLFTFNSVYGQVGPNASTIVTIGQFLVFLQFVKLFELRANRDYAQLLILSLLLMVAGAISTPSLAFGVMFIVYLFASLYVCLLFHLKIEYDGASAAQTLPRKTLDDVTLRQDQRFLARSMRRLTGMVSAVAVVVAVAVFLFFPRGTGAGMFGQLQIQQPAMTGFSDNVSLGELNNIAQNNEVVAQVQLWKNGEPVEGTMPLLLRGRTFDQYGDDNDPHKWRRAAPGDVEREATPDRPFQREGGDPLGTGDQYRQRVSLRPTGTSTLFALPGVVRFAPARLIGRIKFLPDDETISATDGAALRQRLDYEVVSRNASVEPSPVDGVIGRLLRVGRARQRDIPAKIGEYARRPDVSGVDARGRPLAALRPPGPVPLAVDAEIAANVERHLRSTFGYTLDLTGDKRDRDRDPVEQFLYDWKKGHCEYFASAMVLMCQSLGLKARMVTGFKCDEYDANLGHYYVVRQSHAHAWVEVRTPAGWQTFDPTSGNDATAEQTTSAWQSVKHFFGWLEFKWAEKVVAYDGERRDNLIANMDNSMVNAVLRTKFNPNEFAKGARGLWGRVTAWFEGGPGMESLVKVGGTTLLSLTLAYRMFLRLRRRRRIRRRAARIGLDGLPSAEQDRLARQLGFYEQLTTMLERRRIVRAPHQTPAEFGASLSFLPSEVYEAVRRLTQVFYGIRFGRRELPQDEQRELEGAVRGLEPLLEKAVPARG